MIFIVIVRAALALLISAESALLTGQNIPRRSTCLTLPYTHTADMRWIAWAANQSEKFSDELSELEFIEVKEAMNELFQYVEAQETYRAVLDNYSELEVALLSIAQDHIQLGHLSHARAMQQRLLLDRRYANLLSVCRLYLDYASSLAKAWGIEKSFLAITNAEYDSSLGYRVMEALRNYVQHRGFPLDSISHNSRAVDDAMKGPIEVCVIPGLALERLKSDGVFKPSVLAEILALDSEPDLRRWTREYLDGISRCHRHLLSGQEAKTDASIEAYRKICTRFFNRGAQSGTIIRYEQRDAENKVLQRIAFSPEIIEHINALRLENRKLLLIARYHVTNALPAQPKPRDAQKSEEDE